MLVLIDSMLSLQSLLQFNGKARTNVTAKWDFFLNEQNGYWENLGHLFRGSFFHVLSASYCFTYKRLLPEAHCNMQTGPVPRSSLSCQSGDQAIL